MTVTSSDVDTMMANVVGAFYDNNNHRIFPAYGDAVNWGKKNSAGSSGPWWMMAQMLHLFAEKARAFPADSATRARISQQASFILSQYTDIQLKSDGSTDGTINVSDDAAWKMLSFCDLHRITGEPAWLSRLQEALPKILNLYRDPNNPQNDAGNGVLWSPYGLLYAIPTQGATQNIATTYEAGIALAALYVYEQTGTVGFLNYAKGMALRWTKSSSASDPGFQDTGDNPGAYWTEMNLAPGGITPRIVVNQPVDPVDGKHHPFRNGGSPHMIQGAMGIAVVCAKLYRTLNDASFRTHAAEIVSALGSTSIYLVTAGKFLNDRDPYTAGFFACEFVREVLSLKTEGVDPGDKVRTGFVTTGQYIASNPVSGGYYSADWGIPDGYRNGSQNNSTDSWTANGTQHPGDQAVPQQIMTTANSALVILAGYEATALTGEILTDTDGTPLTDAQSNTLVDA